MDIELLVPAMERLVPTYGRAVVDLLGECKGLPLALQVLGSSLQGQPVETWQSVIARLRAIDPTLEGTMKIRAICQPSYDALPPALRDVLRLRVLEDAPTEQVCAALAISEDNLFVRLHRARKALALAM